MGNRSVKSPKSLWVGVVLCQMLIVMVGPGQAAPADSFGFPGVAVHSPEYTNTFYEGKMNTIITNVMPLMEEYIEARSLLVLTFLRYHKGDDEKRELLASERLANREMAEYCEMIIGCVFDGGKDEQNGMESLRGNIERIKNSAVFAWDDERGRGPPLTYDSILKDLLRGEYKVAYATLNNHFKAKMYYQISVDLDRRQRRDGVTNVIQQAINLIDVDRHCD